MVIADPRAVCSLVVCCYHGDAYHFRADLLLGAGTFARPLSVRESAASLPVRDFVNSRAAVLRSILKRYNELVVVDALLEAKLEVTHREVFVWVSCEPGPALLQLILVRSLYTGKVGRYLCLLLGISIEGCVVWVGVRYMVAFAAVRLLTICLIM